MERICESSGSISIIGKPHESPLFINAHWLVRVISDLKDHQKCHESWSECTLESSESGFAVLFSDQNKGHKNGPFRHGCAMAWLFYPQIKTQKATFFPVRVSEASGSLFII